ncbi:MAG: phosphoglycerate mutase, partial [Candidatus Thermoplasmatota archaeon]|nr:phosphoglycerate mutase [Candidatus Thermoplasmatota archaeon]
KLTAKRTIPYLEQNIIPRLEAGKTVFIAAHGNSLRSVIMSIESLSKEQVLSLEVPTGVPIIYHYEDGNWSRLD